MHVPLSWLREYVTVDATAHEIADRLFVSAAEVQRVAKQYLVQTNRTVIITQPKSAGAVQGGASW